VRINRLYNTRLRW